MAKNLSALNTITLGVTLSLLMLTSCGSEDGDVSKNEVINVATTNLKLVVKEIPTSTTASAIGVNKLSVTPDGNIHVLYTTANPYGPRGYYRRIFNATGDSIASPVINDAILNITSKSDVSENWMFVPNTGKLTLSYHPPQTYFYDLYVVDNATENFRYTDASFGALPRPCLNGDIIAPGGYTGYFSNSTVLQSQSFFQWRHSSQLYKYVTLHTVPNQPASEDKLRRAFDAEPLDANTLALSYIDGEYIYLESYDATTQVATKVDSLATQILKPLTRILIPDAYMTARTSIDGKRIVILVRSIILADNTQYLFSTFTFDKLTRKLKQITTNKKVLAQAVVSSDDEGNLLYAMPDNPSDPFASSVFKVGADNVAKNIAHVSWTLPIQGSVTQVIEQHGKIYVSVDVLTSSKPESYLFEVQ